MRTAILLTGLAVLRHREVAAVGAAGRARGAVRLDAGVAVGVTTGVDGAVRLLGLYGRPGGAREHADRGAMARIVRLIARPPEARRCRGWGRRAGRRR